MEWAAGDRGGRTETTRLRAGLTLHRSVVRWRAAWSLTLPQAASEVKLVLARGARVSAQWDGEGELALEPSRFYGLAVRRERELRFAFEAHSSEQIHEQIAIELDRRALLRMLGARALPPALEAALGSPQGASWAHTDAVARARDALLDEDARGPRRALYLEARAATLIAAMMDALDACGEGAATVAAPSEGSLLWSDRDDRERLEHARAMLVAQLESPPSIASLARLAGINEVKLKAGFRSHFGASVYGYLRRARMEQAYALLRDGALGVTEVAQRVGYANASKFAAAFRAHFGERPSDVRG